MSAAADERPLGVDAASGPAVLDTLVPALRRAMAGGSALLPLPTDSGRPAVARLLDVAVPATGRDGTPIALVVPTSGSTGTPKGVLLSVGALLASGAATRDRLGPGPDSPGGRRPATWLLALPTTHVAGLQVLLRAAQDDTAPVCLDLTGGFDVGRFTRAARACRTAADAAGGPAHTSLVPTQLVRVLDAGGEAAAALGALDAVLVGAAATPPALLARAGAAGIRVVTTYGMSETCGGCVYDGIPLDGVTATVEADTDAAEGRVVLAGAVVFSGYAGEPGATAAVLAGDRFATADRGRVDGSVLTVLGRLDAVVVTGGEKVSPEAVERVLLARPDVADAVAVGVTDPEWGQVVGVVVVPAAGPGTGAGASGGDPAGLTLATLRRAVAAALGRAAAPRRLLVVDRLPTLALGKPDRRGLAARLAADPAVVRHPPT